MISLTPDPCGVLAHNLVFHPLSSAYFAYIRNRSAAKSAASSPPVPALISRMMFSDQWVLREQKHFSSPSVRSRSALRTSISSLASFRISSSGSSSRERLSSSSAGWFRIFDRLDDRREIAVFLEILLVDFLIPDHIRTSKFLLNRIEPLLDFFYFGEHAVFPRHSVSAASKPFTGTRTTEYRILNDECRTTTEQSSDFVIRNSVFDIRYSISPMTKTGACLSKGVRGRDSGKRRRAGHLTWICRFSSPLLNWAYLFLNRSTLPVESTSFCLPVNRGWQLEQISP